MPGSSDEAKRLVPGLMQVPEATLAKMVTFLQEKRCLVKKQ
jgi:hypothetical protein